MHPQEIWTLFIVIVLSFEYQFDYARLYVHQQKIKQPGERSSNKRFSTIFYFRQKKKVRGTIRESTK